jgi:signal transduction histidine kinase
LQEALNNVSRHAETKEAWVRLRFLTDTLELEVEDHGKGLVARAPSPGMGLVAMRERAELLCAAIEFTEPADGGTLVRLRVPREKISRHAE